VIVAWRSAWSAGSATLTTVASMNVRLDPMIVATSVHCRAVGTCRYEKVERLISRRASPQKVCNVTAGHDVIGQTDRNSLSNGEPHPQTVIAMGRAGDGD
jgi:hypothetical protein